VLDRAFDKFHIAGVMAKLVGVILTMAPGHCQLLRGHIDADDPAPRSDHL
jgi:hypothetical protein